MVNRTRFGCHVRVAAVAALSVAILIPARAYAQGADNGAESSEEATIEALQGEIAALKSEYEARIEKLEQRVSELETGQQGGAEAKAAQPEAQAPSEEQAAAALRAAAAAAAASGEAGTAGQMEVAEEAEPTYGKARNLSAANPEVSFTGDILGTAGRGGDFNAREFELNLQSQLDPFSLGKVTISMSPDEGASLEEGYVIYHGLPGGLSLYGGKFRQQFGVLNRWHGHALPQVDYPLVIQSYFGEEGLDQTGVGLDWLLPHAFADANELTIEVTDSENDIFGGGSGTFPAVLAHFKNYWDLSPATYLELGLSGVVGKPKGAYATSVYGTDFTIHWAPPNRDKYREVTWRSELMRSEREDELGVQQQAWGGYSYLEGLVHRNLYAGMRVDHVEDPLTPSDVTWGVFPYLTWWQSEFVRLRAEYGHVHHDFLDQSEDRFTFQMTFAAGPHKHDTY